MGLLQFLPEVLLSPRTAIGCSNGIGEIDNRALSEWDAITQQKACIFACFEISCAQNSTSIVSLTSDDGIKMRCKRRSGFQDRLFINKANAASVRQEWVQVSSSSPRCNYEYEAISFVVVQDKHIRHHQFGSVRQIKLLGLDKIFLLQAKGNGLRLLAMVTVLTVAIILCNFL